MNKETIIRSYLAALEGGVITKVLEHFTSDAIIISPLYGMITASKFYADLFKDTAKSQITCHDILLSLTNSVRGAAYFTFEWRFASGQEVKFDVVDVFEFDDVSGKIAKLTIIYDSSSTRQAFNGLRESA